MVAYCFSWVNYEKVVEKVTDIAENEDALSESEVLNEPTEKDKGRY